MCHCSSAMSGKPRSSPTSPAPIGPGNLLKFRASLRRGLLVLLAVVSIAQAPPPTYTLVAAGGRRPLPFRQAGTTDLLPLDQLATVFDFRVQDDPQAGGATVLARGQRVLLTPGQP